MRLSLEAILVCADPFANDENYLLCMTTLEELGATGNKVCCSFLAAMTMAASRNLCMLAC